MCISNHSCAYRDIPHILVAISTRRSSFFCFLSVDYSTDHCSKNSLLYSNPVPSGQVTSGTSVRHCEPLARKHSEGYNTWSVFVCLSVYLFVSDYSRTTDYEAACKRYQPLQCYKSMKNNVGILLKRLHSRDMA